jgi:hypothetical protein
MLLGGFEEGRVTNTNPELGSVRPDEATVDPRPFDLDVSGTWRADRSGARGPLSGTFRVQLSGEEVARLASSSAPGIRVTGVDLREGYLILSPEAEAEAGVLGARVPVGMEGGFTLQMAGYVLRRSGRRSPGGLRKTCSGERA